MSIRILVTVAGVELEVDGDYYKASKGAREKGSGVQLEPDEPATFELSAVYIADVDIADLLSAGRLEEIGNAVLEEIGNAGEPDEDDPRR